MRIAGQRAGRDEAAGAGSPSPRGLDCNCGGQTSHAFLGYLSNSDRRMLKVREVTNALRPRLPYADFAKQFDAHPVGTQCLACGPTRQSSEPARKAPQSGHFCVAQRSVSWLARG